MNEQLNKTYKDAQLTEEQAVFIYDSNIWATWGAAKIARFQLFQERLCVPMKWFQKCCDGVMENAHYKEMHREGKAVVGNTLEEKYISVFGEPTYKEMQTLINEAILEANVRKKQPY